MELKAEINLTEIEVTKLNLQPGETLIITFKSDEIDEYTIAKLRDSFKLAFPNNKVAIMCLPTDSSVQFDTINDPSSLKSPCNNGGCGSCETPCEAENKDET